MREHRQPHVIEGVSGQKSHVVSHVRDVCPTGSYVCCASWLVVVGWSVGCALSFVN